MSKREVKEIEINLPKNLLTTTVSDIDRSLSFLEEFFTALENAQDQDDFDLFSDEPLNFKTQFSSLESLFNKYGITTNIEELSEDEMEISISKKSITEICNFLCKISDKDLRDEQKQTLESLKKQLNIDESQFQSKESKTQIDNESAKNALNKYLPSDKLQTYSEYIAKNEDKRNIQLILDLEKLPLHDEKTEDIEKNNYATVSNNGKVVTIYEKNKKPIILKQNIDFIFIKSASDNVKEKPATLKKKLRDVINDNVSSFEEAYKTLLEIHTGYKDITDEDQRKKLDKQIEDSLETLTFNFSPKDINKGNFNDELKTLRALNIVFFKVSTMHAISSLILNGLRKILSNTSASFNTKQINKTPELPPRKNNHDELQAFEPNSHMSSSSSEEEQSENSDTGHSIQPENTPEVQDNSNITRDPQTGPVTSKLPDEDSEDSLQEKTSERLHNHNLEPKTNLQLDRTKKDATRDLPTDPVTSELPDTSTENSRLEETSERLHNHNLEPKTNLQLDRTIKDATRVPQTGPVTSKLPNEGNENPQQEKALEFTDPVNQISSQTEKNNSSTSSRTEENPELPEPNSLQDIYPNIPLENELNITAKNTALLSVIEMIAAKSKSESGPYSNEEQYKFSHENFKKTKEMTLQKLTKAIGKYSSNGNNKLALVKQIEINVTDDSIKEKITKYIECENELKRKSLSESSAENLRALQAIMFNEIITSSSGKNVLKTIAYSEYNGIYDDKGIATSVTQEDTETTESKFKVTVTSKNNDGTECTFSSYVVATFNKGNAENNTRTDTIRLADESIDTQDFDALSEDAKIRYLKTKRTLLTNLTRDFMFKAGRSVVELEIDNTQQIDINDIFQRIVFAYSAGLTPYLSKQNIDTITKCNPNSKLQQIQKQILIKFFKEASKNILSLKSHEENGTGSVDDKKELYSSIKTTLKELLKTAQQKLKDSNLNDLSDKLTGSCNLLQISSTKDSKKAQELSKSILDSKNKATEQPTAGPRSSPRPSSKR